MFSRLKMLLFLFLLSHSNCVNHMKKSNKNLKTSTSHSASQNIPFTTELHKIIRWKSQPSFYTAPMEYQEIVAVPTTEEVTTELSTTVLQNITAQHWTPILRSSTVATKLPETTEIVYEQHYEHKDDELKTTVGDVGVSNTTFQAIMKEDTKDICPHFIYSKQAFDLEPMADVWQTSYFSLPSKIQCFKILIKKVTEKEKKQNARRFGSFNGVVNWAECNLEIWAAVQNGRRHFLQGLNEDDGIMDNIIIEDPEGTNIESLTVIHEESADQWLVYKNLLLLRDCDNGGVVVFSKVPSKPSRIQVEEALEVFGEANFEGQLACEEEEDVISRQPRSRASPEVDPPNSWFDDLVKVARGREKQAPKGSSWLYSIGGAYAQKWPSPGL